MTKEEFQAAKADLLSDMVKSRDHCVESIMAIKRCQDLEELVATMNSFISQLRDKQFPKVDYIRKHFSSHIYEINQLGVYLDQEGLNVDRDEPVWLFGNCTGTIKSSAIRFRDIIVNDASDLNIDAMNWSLQRIWIKDANAHIKFHKAARAIQLVNFKK